MPSIALADGLWLLSQASMTGHQTLARLQPQADCVSLNPSHTMQAYKTGRWGEANRVLQQCRTMRTDVNGTPLLDGPTDVLLKYMAGFDFQAPATWTGFRELTEK